MQNTSQQIAGDHFSDPYGQHEKWDGSLCQIHIPQYKRYNDRICDDRRQWCQPFVFAQRVGSAGSDQCCQ